MVYYSAVQKSQTTRTQLCGEPTITQLSGCTGVIVQVYRDVRDDVEVSILGG